MRITAIAITVLLSATLAAQAPPARIPSSTFDPARAPIIDRALQRYVDTDRVAGVVALAMQDGRVVYEKAFGWADKEAGRRMTTDTIFRIASQTKALTSTAVMQLIEEGSLALTTRAGTLIPSFAQTKVAIANERGVVRQVPAQRPITVRDLLSHTAGISYGTDPSVRDLYEAKGLGPAAGAGWYTADKDETICETMERLGTLPFVAQPGESWVYGYNTDVLGCIVEKVSGMPLDAYIRDHITAPLGMKDTQFFLPPAQRDRLAAVYSSNADGKYVRAPEGARGQGAYVDGPRKNFAGGAGLLSTARDYARFLEVMRRRRHARRRAPALSARGQADVDQPGWDAAFTDRARVWTGLRNRRPVRRQHAEQRRRVRLGRRLRVKLPRRSRDPARDGDDDSTRAERD